MRRSSRFLMTVLVGVTVVTLLPLHAEYRQRMSLQAENRPPQALAALKLTDLCLATEARHTRHPSLADRHSPFQEHPAALDFFPSGSLILPPAPTHTP